MGRAVDRMGGIGLCGCRPGSSIVGRGGGSGGNGSGSGSGSDMECRVVVRMYGDSRRVIRGGCSGRGSVCGSGSWSV